MAQQGNVQPMSIAGRVVRERERCIGMTPAERCWRKQWLQDQILAPNEPVYVPEYWKERINPIRRFYRAPLDMLYDKLMPTLGKQRAIDYRYITGKLVLMGFGALAIHYYLKYNQNDWTRKGGWRVIRSKPVILPGQEGYPAKLQKKFNHEYADRGFMSSKLKDSCH